MCLGVFFLSTDLFISCLSHFLSSVCHICCLLLCWDNQISLLEGSIKLFSSISIQFITISKQIICWLFFAGHSAVGSGDTRWCFLSPRPLLKYTQNRHLKTAPYTMFAPVVSHTVILRRSLTKHSHTSKTCTSNLVLSIWDFNKSGPMNMC